jgi:predicted AAA+ superfamily ATPase
MGTATAYVRRYIDRTLDDLFDDLPAFMIVGPRACGKTTVAARRAKTVVRLDDVNEAEAFAGDPDGTLRDLAEPILLDEWQAVPDVLGAVKRTVDVDVRGGRFLLTGSVRATWSNAVWPGTGRVIRIPMYPMSIREQLGRVDGLTFFDRLADGVDLPNPADPPDLRGYVEIALRGGFPRPALHLPEPTGQAWLSAYVEELMHHDITELAQSGRQRDPERLRRYFEAYALNSAGLAEHRTIYDAAGLSKVTAIAYEDLLTDLFVADRIPGWASNRLKRLVHQPKRYLVDPALIGAVLRIDATGVLRDGNLLGRVIDTFVMAQLRPEVPVSKGRPRLYHLRTKEGRQEIDLIAELAGQRLIGIEIKATGAPRRSDARHLAWLRDQLGEQFIAGVVFHTGPYVFKLDERITAVPIATLWS